MTLSLETKTFPNINTRLFAKLGMASAALAPTLIVVPLFAPLVMIKFAPLVAVTLSFLSFALFIAAGVNDLLKHLHNQKVEEYAKTTGEGNHLDQTHSTHLTFLMRMFLSTVFLVPLAWFLLLLVAAFAGFIHLGPLLDN